MIKRNKKDVGVGINIERKEGVRDDKIKRKRNEGKGKGK